MVRTMPNRSNTRTWVAVAVAALLLAVAAGSAHTFSMRAAEPQASGYHLLKKFPVGGEGGWDYLVVDSAARRLYVSRSTRLIVLDADSGQSVGEVPDTPGIHGIALAHEFGRGFTSNGRAGNVTIFDLKTLKTIGQVKTGENPDAILYDPITKRVFTFNGRSQDATAVDAAEGTVAGTVPLGGKPEAGVSDGKGHIFVNIEDKSEVVEFDARALTVLHHWPLAPCETPTGLSLDAAHRRLFAGCGSQVMAVMDADTGKVVATLPIGRGVDGTAFDAETSFAFSSNGEGTLTVVREESPDKYSVVENVPTQRGARTIALDSKTHNIYVVTAEFGPAPAATPENPRPRPTMVPNSFVVLLYGK